MCTIANLFNVWFNRRQVILYARPVIYIFLFEVHEESSYIDNREKKEKYF